MKNITIKKLLVFSLTALFSFTGCEKMLDINTDPNNPSIDNSSPSLVFPSAVVSTAGRIGGEYAILGGFMAQYWSNSPFANQYRNTDTYNFNQNNFNNSFDELYAGALNDYNYVIKRSAETGDWRFHLMGTVMKAYTYQVLADLYDQVPYTEAFKGVENLKPRFDDGFTVYTGLVQELDQALAKDLNAAGNSTPGANDLVFNGDMSQWIRFANTLKLKMYLRMVYAKPQEAEAGIRSLYADGGNFLTSSAGLFNFQDQPDKSNPLYEMNVRKLSGVKTNLRASNTFVSFLRANGDPRLEAYYYKEGRESEVNPITGMHQADFNDKTTFISVFKQTATDPVHFISAAESHFLQAEALERFFNGTGAREQYDAGVEAAFQQFNLGARAAEFTALDGRYSYPMEADFEHKLEAIITQKWASFPGSHALEAFFEKNRTGYPKHSAVYSSDAAYIPGQLVWPMDNVTGNKYPKRLMFPASERSTNPNVPALKPITENVWWDKK